MRASLEDRFWSYVEKTSTCWLWVGSCNERGYGLISVVDPIRQRGITRKAHRVAWELCRGSIPPGLHVLHRCDVRQCVCPGHLFLGTHADNMRDALLKGRIARGDRHGFKLNPDRIARGEKRGAAKLTDRLVRIIRKRAIEGVSYKQMAVEYGVSAPTISAAAQRKLWTHVED